MTIFDLACLSYEAEDPATPFLEWTPKNLRTLLFCVQNIVQNQTLHFRRLRVCKNLIDDDVFKLLPFLPPLTQRNIQMLGGNGAPLFIQDFGVLPVTIGGTLVWHELALVRKLPLDVLIGADILQPHLCSQHYL